MTATMKKFIGNNQVDGTKIQLLNAQSLVALNSSASPTNLLQLDGANNLLIQTQIDGNTLAITNIGNGVNPQDAATYGQLTALAYGLSWKTYARSATTAGLPTYTYSANVITETGFGALPAQDGVTLTVGDRLLVKDETSTNQPYNGIYVVTVVGDIATSFVLTRATDANTAAELQSATVQVGPEASTQNGFVYWEDATITTIGTDNVVFINILMSTSYAFTNGLQLVGSTVSVLPFDGSLTTAAGGVSVLKDPAGALSVSGSGLAVAVDDSTIAISSDQLIVKSAGITETQIASSSFSASGAITGGSGTKIAVAVDGTTVKIVTNALKASTQQVDNLTLNSTDITNQYIDLTYAIDATASVWLSVIGGPIQQNGTDYTVSATGGAGGVGRITFAGDLATGGASALVSGDILIVGYEHF